MESSSHDFKWRDLVLGNVVRSLLSDKKIESVLDIGGGVGTFGKIFKTKKYVNLNIFADSDTKGTFRNADVKIDLNNFKKLPFKNNSFDLVVLSQVLEHLFYPEKVIEEVKRVSKKYILVGLPNEVALHLRIKLLKGESTIGYSRHGHHYMFNFDVTEKFIKTKFAPDFKIMGKYFQRIAPTRKIPLPNYFVKKFPNLFAREFYYLLVKTKK